MSQFTFDERPTSRSGTMNPPSEVREYVAAGSNDSAFVRAYAFQATPTLLSSSMGTLYRQDIRITCQGHELFIASVPYGPLPKAEWTWKSSTTGGSFHITHSKATVARYAPEGKTARDYGGAINVQPDFSVAGADIIIPALKITITYKHPLAVLTIPYAKAMARLTGKVNSAPFLTFAPGEVLFLGMDAVDGTNTEAQADYHFACEENLQNQIIGGISGVSKQGHDLLWSEFKQTVNSGVPGATLLGLHVERVYNRVDLAAALGFGG